MTGDEGYFLARVINALFRGHPVRAFYVFASIIALALGIRLFTAERPDELIFPVLGLAFVLIVVISRALHDIRRMSITDLTAGGGFQVEQTVEQVEDYPQEPDPPQVSAPDTSDQAIPLVEIPSRPTGRRSLPLIGALFATLMVLPVLCISALSMPAGTHQDVEGVSLVMNLACLVVSPISALLGAVGGIVVARVTQHNDSRMSPRVLAILTGCGIGLVAGSAAAIFMIKALAGY